ncbi:hypothetical protein BDN67DRAFT_783780 [Paxillus ammoniavirescens]|nr:hypothetical protein BDN67DRAFT_783780 [Paxillus ammoniavirescens]
MLCARLSTACLTSTGQQTRWRWWRNSCKYYDPLAPVNLRFGSYYRMRAVKTNHDLEPAYTRKNRKQNVQKRTDRITGSFPLSCTSSPVGSRT